MKSLSSAVTTEAAASQSGWGELYDIYLSAAIVTPWGTISTLRLCTVPGGYTFFTPEIAPEPAGTRGDAQAYSFWPLQREVLKTGGENGESKLAILGSNVTSEWADMLTDVDWYDTPVVVRKVPISASGLAASDCAILFIGLVDSASFTTQQIQLACSNDLVTLNTRVPREPMHSGCRFRWGDDFCTAIKYLAANHKAKTAGSGSTANLIKSTDFSEDTATSGWVNQAVTAEADDDKITLSAHGLADGQLVRFRAAAMPGGLTAERWYAVRDAAANDFKAALTVGGTAIDLTTDGTTVTMDSESPRGTDLVAALADGAISSSSNKGGYEDHMVKAGGATWWEQGSLADWGNSNQAESGSTGIWEIDSAQEGLKNYLLKPWIQFDFGSAKVAAHWRLRGRSDAAAVVGDMPRLVAFFSSVNNSDFVFESYFELGAVVGQWHDVYLPSAASARYWRICLRNRWRDEVYRSAIFQRVEAYEVKRNWWAEGRLVFASNTATAALRSLTRRVLASWSGAVMTAPFPVAAANGDTFTIERGCGRTFNDCAARGNVENFGGFNSIPYESVPK